MEASRNGRERRARRLHVPGMEKPVGSTWIHLCHVQRSWEDPVGQGKVTARDLVLPGTSAWHGPSTNPWGLQEHPCSGIPGYRRSCRLSWARFPSDLGLLIPLIPRWILPGAASSKGTHQEQLGDISQLSSG